MIYKNELRRPKAVGVPVYTILGAYTTNNPAKSLLYPIFYSNWGVVYDRKSSDKKDNSCWLSIIYKDGSQETENLGYVTGKILQVNVNLDTTKFPKEVKVICKTLG